MKEYPRIGLIDEKNHPKGLCAICSKNKADSELTIEFTYMRGDDSVYNIHKSCLKGLTDCDIVFLCAESDWRP